MTPLRTKMIDTMLMHGLAPRTQKSYLIAITDLAKYFHRSPDTLTIEELEAYFLYLIKDKGLAPASCRLVLNAVRFLFHKVLKQKDFTLSITLPKKKQRIPELLSLQEVNAILHATHNQKHFTLLLLCYSCGLRVNELVNIQLSHIDADQHLLRIEHGKGEKDRYVILSDILLSYLRNYWKCYRPRPWLFQSPHKYLGAISISCAQRTFNKAKQQANITKTGGIHSLRHAYATHQLAAGMPVHQLQQLLGHDSIHTTMRYVHWIPQYKAGHGTDLIQLLGLNNGQHYEH